MRSAAEQVREELHKLADEVESLSVGTALDFVALHATEEELLKLRRIVR